jgi:diaminohydroxyphosphoribosylaminopyrimidine deaminase / 5-amino-6-(5-phosphoribosylamino)uracil reductase
VRDGAVVGAGWHRRAGEEHAETVALRQAGERARGATLYVNLEPCPHQGRTPPCAAAVVAAGVRRVVACHADPDPRVRGRGLAALARAGVEVASGTLAAEAMALNLGYLVPALRGRPAVTLKWAMSLDGRIATAAGDSRWISSPPARRWALELREEHAAVLVGSGTVLADDPRLDRRLRRAAGPNLRAVLDRRLRLPPAARLLASPGPVLVYTESDDAARTAALRERGAEVVRLPAATPAAVLGDLHRRGVRSVLVEGGGEVAAAFVAAGLYDRVLAACAPVLIGGRAAPGPVGGDGVAALAAAPRLEGLTARRRGPDLLLAARRLGCLAELADDLAAAVAGVVDAPAESG